MKNEIGVAVDLGSTTIAVSCIDLISKEEIAAFSFSNPQCVYGADVITRIKHCIDKPEMLGTLKTIVIECLKDQLKKHLAEPVSAVSQIVFSGNTTMLHIMRGLSVNGLAFSPFTPIDIEYKEVRNQVVTVAYPPGFSAFVGADILAGAEYLEMGKSDKYDLLIDLGTNGEMLLLNNEKGYATSTACGPVFDHAVIGAVYGSECIKAIANCVKRGLIDKSGQIPEPFFDKGIEIDKDFVIRQQNVRSFQLAKGAIHAGIICLMEKAGITFDDINKVYISGGLGFYMDISDALTVKMLPIELKGKITVSGNTSLEGAKKMLLTDEIYSNAKDEVHVQSSKEQLLHSYEDLQKKVCSFELANFEKFDKIYVELLNF